jgi:hypothetical protein
MNYRSLQFEMKYWETGKYASYTYTVRILTFGRVFCVLVSGLAPG